jgi:hypothetical protein
VAGLLLPLAVVACIAGVMAGTVAGLQTNSRIRFGAAFLVYLGLLATAATTWVQSMDALPLALVYGAGTGILPFAAGFFCARKVVTTIRARVRKRR